MRRRRSKQASAPEEVCLPLFLLPFHSHTFLLLLTCALLAWPHHTKEGGCIQELKPAADTRAKGRGRRLIHRRLWRRAVVGAGGAAVVGAGSRREPLLGLCVKRAPPYSQFTSKTRAVTRAYCWEHTTTAPPPAPPFFHHYILFLCFSTKFWSSRLTRPTETRYYRAYITLHICVVVIKLVSFSSAYIIFTTLGLKNHRRRITYQLYKTVQPASQNNKNIQVKCLCVKWDHHLQRWKFYWNKLWNRYVIRKKPFLLFTSKNSLIPASVFTWNLINGLWKQLPHYCTRSVLCWGRSFLQSSKLIHNGFKFFLKSNCYFEITCVFTRKLAYLIKLK